jgi:hypothetical protein
MGHNDPQHDQEERERLTKLYAEMDESELEDTAYHAGRFNDVARQALKEAIVARGLNIELEADFKRPRAVTVLALLAFVNAAFCLLLAVLTFTRPELVPTGFIARHSPRAPHFQHSPPPHSRHSPPPDFGPDISAVAGYSMVAVLYIVFGVGLWSLQWWARLGLVVSAGALLARWGIGLVTGLFFDPRYPGHVFTSAGAIGLLLSGAILYILTLPEVKRVFTEIPSMPTWPWGW